MTTYDEMVKALMFYIGTFEEGDILEALDEVYNPIEFIATALDEYRKYLSEVA